MATPEPIRIGRSQNKQKFFASFFQKRSAFFLVEINFDDSASSLILD